MKSTISSSRGSTTEGKANEEGVKYIHTVYNNIPTCIFMQLIQVEGVILLRIFAFLGQEEYSGCSMGKSERKNLISHSLWSY